MFWKLMSSKNKINSDTLETIITCALEIISIYIVAMTVQIPATVAIHLQLTGNGNIESVVQF